MVEEILFLFAEHSPHVHHCPLCENDNPSSQTRVSMDTQLIDGDAAADQWITAGYV